MGNILWWLPNELRTVSLVNLELCFPGMSGQERSRLARQSLIATFQTFAEAGPVWKWPNEKLKRLIVEVVHEELLDEALPGGQGAILLLPHIGNWELINHYLLPRHPFLALYRPTRLAELDEPIRRSRQRTGAEMVPATAVGLRRIYRGLEAGKLILILPDQEPLKRHGVFAPFFGVEALTMTLVGGLVRRFDSRVFFGYAERRPDGFFRVRFRPAPEGLGDADNLVAATRLNRGIEDCVRSCPEQYMWSYKRFKTRPPGEAEELKSRLNLPASERFSYRALTRLSDLEPGA